MAINNLAHDVLILGGGHAGVRAARQLIRRQRPGERLDVALVSRDNVELWHGLMPQMLANTVQPEHVVVPLREVLKGVSIYVYEIREIDLEHQRVTIDRGTDGEELILTYRTLVLAMGSTIDLSRFPGMLEHALPTKTIGDFVHVRNQVIGMLEAASEQSDASVREEQLTFVVAGAGFAGVEVASEIDELVGLSLPLYPHLSRPQLRIISVDPGTRVLPSMSERVSAMAYENLTRRGIEVRLGTAVASASAHDVRLSNGEVIASRNLIATAGTGINPVVQPLAVNFVRGRILCDEFGRVSGWPGVFAAGDVAAIPDSHRTPYPPTVTFAIAAGESVGMNVLATLRGEPLRRIEHESVAQVGIMSRRYAVAQIRGWAVQGRLGVLAGRLLFLSYMPNWRRRGRLLLDWLTSCLFGRDVTELQMDRTSGLSRMRFKAGDEIVRAGELGNRFYVITDGEVEIIDRRDRARVLGRLGPGEHFGEIALSQGVRRTASVRAAKDTGVIAMDRSDFRLLSESVPALRAEWRPASVPVAEA